MMGNEWSMGLFWISLIVLIVWFLTELFTHQNSQHPIHESARQILDRRLAQGEIDQSEYEEKKRLLGKP